MSTPVVSALFVLATWWLSTGVVLKLAWLAPATFRATLTAAGVVSACAFYGLFRTSAVASPAAAYVSFACALALWGALELAFLLGVVVGPRAAPCPAGARGWRRLRYAISAVIYHQAALAAAALGAVIVTRSGPNHTGATALVVLWAMRLSAEMNVFLGVRNLNVRFVPPRLHYLITYFKRARLNPLIPFSIAAGAGVAMLFFHEAFTPEATPFTACSGGLVATLVALGVVEHVFLAVPVPDAVLWRWAVRRAASS